jgi:TolA-binding protein
MKRITLSVLLAAATVMAGAAHAQDASGYIPVPYTSSEQQRSGDGAGWQSTPGEYVARVDLAYIEDGLAALEVGDFVRAERVFTDFLRSNRNSAQANFYLGATRMDLGKWEDAKRPLQIAAQKIPKHPDPKSRLGVTYARLGDTAAAEAQRAKLVAMADACKGTCELSPYILNGIRMIDDALAETPAGQPRGQG